MTTFRSSVKLNRDGRVALPARMRKEVGFTPDSDLVAYVEDGRLVLETREHLSHALKALVKSQIPDGVSLVDELIAERRAEAIREAREM